MRIPPICCLVFCCLMSGVSGAAAQDTKPEQQPRIVASSPLAIAAGVPVKLALRGQRLDEVTEFKIGDTSIKAELVSKGKAAVPQNYDAKRIGDTQAEIKLTLPPETATGKLTLTAISAAGASLPYEIDVIRTEDLVEEKEPNDGFKTAQSVQTGLTIVGTIHEGRNVDVFKFNAEAGQKLVIEVFASRSGSPLDPFLTLYDETGQVLGGSDDNVGRDPRFEATFSKSGPYFVTVQDANDSGGPHFSYLLKLIP